MSTMELMQLIEKLPADKQKEVEKLVFELTGNNSKNIDTIGSNTSTIKKQPMKFGDLKGFVTYISDDFDEPLDEFKDYM